MRVTRFLLYMLRIRRVEFRVAEIPILAIPVLLLIRDASPLKTFAFWEGVFIFFLLFAFGDMINCLADRDLDAVYKPHLSEAVYGLGVRFVTFQVAATAVVALALSAHLSWLTGRWLLFVLVAVGLALGAAYSVPPFRLKGRGFAQLVCLWLIIFVGPMLFVALLVDAFPPPALLVLAAAYGTLQMGVILVNTAEDYPEDLAAGIRTTVVATGLREGVTLALWLAAAGSAGLLATLAVLFRQRQAGASWMTALLPVACACAYVSGSIWSLRRAVAGDELAGQIRTVKRAAKRVPLWVTVVAWSTLAAAYALYRLAGSHV
ncbi:MAG TPA: UbiA family prenyltransferase [Pyrinomonadaceae bacterium]|jgi:4-hydroxybenzoate polyprenyltransferase